ncbi:hypothetical protein HGRIS_007533 [Hohenbuehelia grisea]|uniref:Uncharacterized protein n=1 Tax=Hohenbuehelia grisea TaxID=104357 RepID=A0ABR3J542_9AGAR
MATISHFMPSTPTPRRIYTGDFQHKPITSSPLASPTNPASSPAFAAQSRRREQYKGRNRLPSTPAPSSVRNAVTVRAASLSGGSVFGSGGSKNTNRPSQGTIGGLFGTASTDPKDVKRDALREKFKAKCLQRAMKERNKAVRGKRYAGPSSEAWSATSDAMDEDDDDTEETVEDIMRDELFQKILENANRKTRHSYRVSYEREVGSSFDPNLEDAAAWEAELSAAPLEAAAALASDIPPEATFDEELEAYFLEHEAFVDWEDLPEDALEWDNIIDDDAPKPSSDALGEHQMDIMDLSA